MSNKVPTHRKEKVKEHVFRLADHHNYLLRSRSDNNLFLDKLVISEDVGGVLTGYMKSGDVRTYIKDSILNQYTKLKAQESRPKNLEQLISERLGVLVCCVEHEDSIDVSLLRVCGEPRFIVVADGTVMKWETALKKAMVYAAQRPFSARLGVSVEFLLTLYARERKLAPGELKFINKVLSRCNASAYVYGE